MGHSGYAGAGHHAVLGLCQIVVVLCNDFL